MQDLRYSVDKIKLYIYGIKLLDIKNLMDVLSLDINVAGYESKSITSCRYNYRIKEQDYYLFDNKIKGNSFYLGIEPNWSKDKNKTHRDLVLEFNPNKIALKDFDSINSILPVNEYRTEIMSLDIAIDIYDYHINDLIVYKRHGNEYKCSIEHNKTETIYLGAFGDNGHIKIYDKAKEQKISDMKWTRYEITYKKLGFMDIRDTEVIEKTKLADVKIIDKNISLENLKETERVLMLSTMDNPDYINMLGRVMKSKIRGYHDEYLRSLDISKERITETYKNFKVI